MVPQSFVKAFLKIDVFQSYDEDMRHGRKSRSQKFDGYKRHVLKDLELQMVSAVGVTRAFRSRSIRNSID